MKALLVAVYYYYYLGGTSVSHEQQASEQQEGNDGQHTVDNISFLVLNVCGLRRRLLCDEFKALICEHDICLFCETKTDDLDLCEVQDEFETIGYDVHLKNRSHCSRVRSGGLCVVYKKTLKNGVSFKDTDCKYVQWMVLNSSVTKLKNRMLLGLVYIPPEGSRFASESAFVEIENELLDLQQEGDDVCLCGDFNARTKKMVDYVEMDEFLCNQVGIDDNSLHVIDPDGSLEAVGIGKARATCDAGRPNNFGYKLIDMCKGHSLYICNGRVGTDRDQGSATTRNGTVIDYVLGTCTLLRHICSLEVLQYDPLFSDVHAPISFSVMTNIASESADSTSATTKVTENVERYFWVKDKSDAFSSVISREWVNSMVDLIDSGLVDSVDQIANEIREQFTLAASTTLRPGRNAQKGRRVSKPWFNLDCLEKRKMYRNAKKNYRLSKSIQEREAMIRSSKGYKKAINKAVKEHKQVVIKKLRNLKKSDPKEYWKILSGHKPKEKNVLPIDEFFEHFRDLGNVAEEDDTSQQDVLLANSNETLNGLFTHEEIAKAIKRLPNNKCPGIDNILNEYIKATAEIVVPLYVRFFNYILTVGEVPREWLIGMVLPIYKGKGDKKVADNYRGIALLSCMGKLFTSLLNDRIGHFCKENHTILENQAGFRRFYSTTDHIFLLKNIVDLYLEQKKKLYCVFIDYRKAFDSVWRNGLWVKCLRYGINGKIIQVIRNMYNNIKSCVTCDGTLSEYFECNVGVRQGENLSPLLFALYVNDLQSYLVERGCTPLTIGDEQTRVMLKLLMLLYADDTVILSDTAEGLQKALDVLSLYCTEWKLQVNSSKTKVIVFSKRKLRRYPVFLFEGEILDRVDCFKYLGVHFSYNGSFEVSKKTAIQQAQRAMYSLIGKARRLGLPIDIQLELFDSMVVPILLYGGEVWGCGKLDIVERLHLKFCKFLLQAKSSTPTCMVYGELGRYPIAIACKVRIIQYWGSLLHGNADKYSFIMYKIMYNHFINDKYVLPWVKSVKQILDDCGLSNIWINQEFPSVPWLVNRVKLSLQDQFKQTWLTSVQDSSKCVLYKSFKTDFVLEKYLLNVPFIFRKYITKVTNK